MFGSEFVDGPAAVLFSSRVPLAVTVDGLYSIILV